MELGKFNRGERYEDKGSELEEGRKGERERESNILEEGERGETRVRRKKERREKG